MKSVRGEIVGLLDQHAMLQEAAAYVEASGNHREAALAKERLADLEDRLKALLNQTLGDMAKIEGRLGIQRDDSVRIYH